MELFDIFPKADETQDRVRTNVGGFLSFASIIFLIGSIVLEIYDWTQIRVQNSMVLNEQPLPPTIPIVIDMDIYNNCSDLHFEITNKRRTEELEHSISIKKFEQKSGFCKMHYAFTVPNVPGSFHVGLGMSYNDANDVHKHITELLDNKNLSHNLNYLIFGSINDIKSPLDNTSIILDKNVGYMITYELNLVPIFENTKSFVGTGYQISASLSKTNLEKIRTKGLAGIVFSWDFSAISFQKTANRTPIILLLSHILGVAGVFFVFVRFFDGILYGFTNLFMKK